MIDLSSKTNEGDVDSRSGDTKSRNDLGDRKNLDISILVIALIIVIIYWSLISLLKYFYFQATVFDLGINMQNLWGITHGNWTLYKFFFQFEYQGIAFLLFPLQYGGYPALLMFQSFFISLGAFAIYYISVHKGIDNRSSLFISIAYLLYFPVSGMTWFDFHFQSLFVPLFLFAYLAYIKEKYWMASIIFLISGIVRFPYAIFPLIFWSISLMLDQKQRHDRTLAYFATGNILLYLLILVSSYFMLRDGYIETHATLIVNPFYNLPIKLITILVLLVPVLFIPVLSARWYIFMVPFTFLLFFANNPVYEFPWLFMLQYSASFIAFVFLALIESLTKEGRSDFRHSPKNNMIAKLRNLTKAMRIQKKDNRKIASVLLVAAFSTALIYQAIGPIAILSRDGITIGSITQLNEVEQEQFHSISSLIPKNCTFVLIQNNLPQFLPGPAGNDIRVPGYIGPNITSSDIVNNTFPWSFGTFKSVTPINYVIGDLNSFQWYNQSLVNGFQGMANITAILLSSGYYGLLGIDGPFYVLERGYTGSPLIYQPSNV